MAQKGEKIITRKQFDDLVKILELMYWNYQDKMPANSTTANKITSLLEKLKK